MLEDDAKAWTEIAEWIEAARVAHVMEHNRLGVMGHYYGGMLDIYSDLTQQSAYFGGHVEVIEVEELAALRNQVNEADVSGRVAEFKSIFDVQPDCSEGGAPASCRNFCGAGSACQKPRAGLTRVLPQGHR